MENALFPHVKNTDLPGFSMFIVIIRRKTMQAAHVWPEKTSLELPAVGDV
jgi:hypothetical protein